MGEVVITVAKWILKFAYFTAVLLSFMVIISLITTWLVVGFNMGVLSDIFGLIQLWLPFNLNILLAWMSVAVTAYVTYRVLVMSFNMLNSWLGKS